MAIRVNSNANAAGVTAIGYNSGNNSTIPTTNCTFFGNDANVNAGSTGIDKSKNETVFMKSMRIFDKMSLQTLKKFVKKGWIQYCCPSNRDSFQTFYDDWIIYLQRHLLPIKIAYKFFKVHLMAWAVWDPTGIRDVFGPKSDFGQHFFYITSSRMEDDSCFMKYQKPLFYSIILHLMFSHYQDIQVIESVSIMEHSRLNGVHLFQFNLLH